MGCDPAYILPAVEALANLCLAPDQQARCYGVAGAAPAARGPTGRPALHGPAGNKAGARTAVCKPRAPQLTLPLLPCRLPPPLQSQVVDLVLERFQQADAADLPALARFLLQHAVPGAELKKARAGGRPGRCVVWAGWDRPTRAPACLSLRADGVMEPTSGALAFL